MQVAHRFNLSYCNPPQVKSSWDFRIAAVVQTVTTSWCDNHTAFHLEHTQPEVNKKHQLLPVLPRNPLHCCLCCVVYLALEAGGFLFSSKN